MMVGARNGCWAKSGAPLPYDEELEWIRPATALGVVEKGFYADTGVDTSDNVGYRIRLQRLVNTTSDIVAFGARLNSNSTRFFTGGYNGLYYVGYNNTYTTSGLRLHNWYTISNNFLNDKKGRLNGSEFASFSSESLSYSKRLYYGAYHAYTGTSLIQRYYYYKHGELEISVGTNIVRDFIPVRIGDKAYIYDKINGELRGNLGTDDYAFG